MTPTLEDVRRALAARRAGRAAQERMMPRPRPGDRLPPIVEGQGQQAAVLFLLYRSGEGLHFFLTHRTETVGAHKGQVSLPGGAREEDETLEQTALREAWEELGIDTANVEILGAPLTPVYIPVSDYWVTAFVGYYRGDAPSTNAATEEVMQVIPTPLSALVDDTIIGEEEWELRGMRVSVPFFQIAGHKVWGATAMILAEFAAMLRDTLAKARAGRPG
jgi:8-oxo-dGTP pyrophosphatase MutT (NUDIX family)